MKIPADAIIPNDKITRYLLVKKFRNDKSKFLAQAGFTLDNSDALTAAIKLLIQMSEAVEDRSNEYGDFFQVEGELLGANGVTLSVVTIWLRRRFDGKFQFVTLKPHR